MQGARPASRCRWGLLAALWAAGCTPTEGVNPYNRPPEAQAVRTVEAPGLVRFEDVSTDPDGDRLTREWRLVQKEGHATFALNGRWATLNSTHDGLFYVHLTVSDGLVTDTFWRPVDVSGLGPGVTIEVGAGGYLPEKLPLPARAVASGEPSGWGWQVWPREGVVISDPAAPETTLTFPSTGTYTVTAWANYANGGSHRVQETLRITQRPAEPRVRIGPDAVVEVGSTVVLGMTASVGDLDWELTNTPSGASPTVTVEEEERSLNNGRLLLRFAPDVPGPYQLAWSARDAFGQTTRRTTRIHAYAEGALPVRLDPGRVYALRTVGSGSHGAGYVEDVDSGRFVGALHYMAASGVPRSKAVLLPDGGLVYPDGTAVRRWVPEVITSGPLADTHFSPEANDRLEFQASCALGSLVVDPFGVIHEDCGDGFSMRVGGRDLDYEAFDVAAVQEGPVLLVRHPRRLYSFFIVDLVAGSEVEVSGNIAAARAASDGGFVVLIEDAVEHLGLDGTLTPLWDLAPLPADFGTPGAGAVIDGDGAVWQYRLDQGLVKRTAQSSQVLGSSGEAHLSRLLTGATPVEVQP